MKSKIIPYLNKEASVLFYGAAGDGFAAGLDMSELLDTAFACGINAIDTARVYGQSEKSIGMWLKHFSHREELVLLSKCAHPDPDTGKDRVSEKDIREDFKVSQELLNTDYLDIYLLHRDDPSVPVSEIVSVMNALIEEGKIKTWGGSNWSTERIREANTYALYHGLQPMSMSSPHYGLGIQANNPWIGTGVSLTGEEMKKDRLWYKESRLPILCYSSLGRGMFSGKFKSEEADKAGSILDEFALKGYFCEENIKRLARCESLAAKKDTSVAAIATAWLLASKMNAFALISASKPSRIAENAKAVDLILTEEELSFLASEDI